MPIRHCERESVMDIDSGSTPSLGRSQWCRANRSSRWEETDISRDTGPRCRELTVNHRLFRDSPTFALPQHRRRTWRRGLIRRYRTTSWGAKAGLGWCREPPKDSRRLSSNFSGSSSNAVRSPPRQKWVLSYLYRGDYSVHSTNLCNQFKVTPLECEALLRANFPDEDCWLKESQGPGSIARKVTTS